MFCTNFTWHNFQKNWWILMYERMESDWKFGHRPVCKFSRHHVSPHVCGPKSSACIPTFIKSNLHKSKLLFERRRLCGLRLRKTFPVIRFRWTDISNSRIPAQMAGFLVSDIFKYCIILIRQAIFFRYIYISL